MPKNTGNQDVLRGAPLRCGRVRERIEHQPHPWRNVYPPTMCPGYNGKWYWRLYRWLVTGW